MPKLWSAMGSMTGRTSIAMSKFLYKACASTRLGGILQRTDTLVRFDELNAPEKSQLAFLKTGIRKILQAHSRHCGHQLNKAKSCCVYDLN